MVRPACGPIRPRRNERSRRATLDATIELMVRQGYAKVTIEAIATQARVSKRTIYRWWPSKAILALEAINDRIGHALDFPDTGDITTDLSTPMNELAALLTDELGKARRSRLLLPHRRRRLAEGHPARARKPERVR